MPVHGIRLDLEFLAIAAGAAIVSFFVTGEIVSNMLFTALIATLFFLMGLHMDRGEVRKNAHKRKELLIGLTMVYVAVPLIAFGFSRFLTGPLHSAILFIGISTVAIGSSVVWSNIGKGDDGTALLIAILSLFLGIGIIPALLVLIDTSVSVTAFTGKNMLVLGVPFLLGLFAQRFENFLIDDLRHHFSKVSLWLLVLIMGVQFHLSFSNGLSILREVAIAVPVLAGFVLLTFSIGYFGSRNLGVMERKARAIGFATGSKGLAVALFIAAQLSPEAVIFVSLHYFVRQGVCGAIAEFFKHGTDFRRLIEGYPILERNIP